MSMSVWKQERMLICSAECEARMKNGMFVFLSTIVAIVVGTIHENIWSFNLCLTRVGGMMGEDDSQMLIGSIG